METDTPARPSRLRTVVRELTYSGATAVVLLALVAGEFRHQDASRLMWVVPLFFLCIWFAPVYGIVLWFTQDQTQWYAMGNAGLLWCIGSLVAVTLVPLLPEGNGRRFAIACSCVLWGWSEFAVAGSAV